MICPTHNCEMPWRQTQYGKRFHCEEPGCTVVGWDGPTSTPADLETRQLRHRVHLAFDPLWKTRARWRSRNNAYRWLRKFTKLPEHLCHIGMFNKDQCNRVLAELERDVV